LISKQSGKHHQLGAEKSGEHKLKKGGEHLSKSGERITRFVTIASSRGKSFFSKAKKS